MISQQVLTSQHILSYAAAHFDTYSYLNGNNIAYPHHAFPRLIGLGVADEYFITKDDAFSWKALDQFLHLHKGKYLFVCLNYRLKNQIEHFHSQLRDPLEFPLVHAYLPSYLFIEENNQWKACNAETEELLSRILAETNQQRNIAVATQVSNPVAQFSHLHYISIVNRIKKELAQGNIYEINFCNSYTGSFEGIDCVDFYHQLNAISPMPFSALYKHKEHVLISASPERFIQRTNNRLVSQPIKGTAGRLKNEKEDIKQKEQLQSSLKEQTENIMIVDLVRNDLSKLCKGGSVKVEELCKVYTFEKVHQLISTIIGELEQKDLPFSEIIKALFPMGSMTGAPKLRAMQLIDQLEQEDRGLFSGTVGYVAPNGDFDFNVIIRSLLLNEAKGIYKFHAGSAITMASDAELEYQECAVKTLPIRLLMKPFESALN